MTKKLQLRKMKTFIIKSKKQNFPKIKKIKKTIQVILLAIKYYYITNKLYKLEIIIHKSRAHIVYIIILYFVFHSPYYWCCCINIYEKL